MAGRHTFHTPSFGDEEFELPHNSTLIGGSSSHTFDMSNISAADSIHNFTQWSVSNPPDHTKSEGVTLTGNEFIVLRSPRSGDNVSSSSAMGDQSDDSDDNSMKPDTKPEIVDITGDTKKKQKRDPNEPQKPVSAYALFFRDTQAAIKGQNPSASFDEVSQIVSSMWDAVNPEHKNVYKKKAEDAKKEYRKSLAAYRANVLARSDDIIPRVDKSAPANRETSVALHPVVQPVLEMNAISVNADAHSNFGQNQQPTTAALQSPTTVNSNPPNNGVVAENDTTTCVRSGCPNPAVVSVDWEDEYCSNECVITHCRDIFSKWVQDIGAAPENYSTS